MKTDELIKLIHEAPKKTPIVAYVQCSRKIPHSYNQILVGDRQQILNDLNDYFDDLENVTIDCLARNSAIPKLNIENLNARIEFGALIRDHVRIEDHAVVMMGAIVNAGVRIGENSMIDMGAVLGARAQVGRNCHVGANAVLAGVLEPACADPVVIEDGVVIGANAVVLEGVRVKKNAVVAAGAIVTVDVEEDCVVAGAPAKVVKMKDKKTESKTQLVFDLRNLD